MSESKDYITHEEEKGSVNISPDVLSTVAAAAALEVEGVASISTSTGKEIVDFLSIKKNAARGIKINYNEDSLNIDINVLLNLGAEIGPTANKVQSAVIDAIEATTGLKVNSVNVHVSGLSLK